MSGGKKDLQAFIDALPPTPAETGPIRIENHAGYLHIPVGIAGPLELSGPGMDREKVFAAMATTEAALVASTARGAKAFNLCGGLHFDVLAEGQARAPAFKFPTPKEAIGFSRRIPGLRALITSTAESTSRHLRLQSLRPVVIGRRVHLNMSFLCGDAAGQNMVTFASQKVAEVLQTLPIAAEFQLQGAVMDGGMTSDKKPAWSHVREPQGVQVVAWGCITNEVCERVLGVTTHVLYQLFHSGKDGEIRSGVFGFNMNAMNLVAAVYLATGQDAACLSESCWTQLVFEYDVATKDLALSMHCAGLSIGTVGGGTGYATQNHWLNAMGCAGMGKKHRLAGIIAAFALALDLSTGSAIANNTFSSAHERLARGTVGGVKL